MSRSPSFDNSKFGLWLRQARGLGLYAYFRIMSTTSQWEITGEEHLLDAEASNRPLLWAGWHGQLMPIMSYGYRFNNASRFIVVAVGDKRYDILSLMIQKLKAETVPVDMGGNPMSSGRSLLKIIKAMNNGRYSMIAPDGPDGPPFQAKDGVAYLAKKAKALILPIGAWTKDAYQLKRWDNYLVPYPFAKIHLAFGEPFMPDPKKSRTERLEQISDALNKAHHLAKTAAEQSSFTPHIPIQPQSE